MNFALSKVWTDSNFNREAPCPPPPPQKKKIVPKMIQDGFCAGTKMLTSGEQLKKCNLHQSDDVISSCDE